MQKIRAKKVNMTQLFLETGVVEPVTLVILESDPKDQAEKGSTLNSDSEGRTLESLTLKEGDVVTVSGISKGKGFQGVVKRHGFKGGPRSHGQKHSQREPGS